MMMLMMLMMKMTCSSQSRAPSLDPTLDPPHARSRTQEIDVRVPEDVSSLCSYTNDKPPSRA